MIYKNTFDPFSGKIISSIREAIKKLRSTIGANMNLRNCAFRWLRFQLRWPHLLKKKTLYRRLPDKPIYSMCLLQMYGEHNCGSNNIGTYLSAKCRRYLFRDLGNCLCRVNRSYKMVWMIVFPLSDRDRTANQGPWATTVLFMLCSANLALEGCFIIRSPDFSQLTTNSHTANRQSAWLVCEMYACMHVVGLTLT